MRKRKREGRSGITAALSASLLVCCASVFGQSPRYAIFDVGHLGNPEVASARALNNRGIVTGYSTYDPTGFSASTHAFAWANGELLDIGIEVDCCSTGRDINERGEIVGSGWWDGSSWPTIWDPSWNASRVPNFDADRGGFEAMNILNEFAGSARFDGGSYVPIFYSNGVLVQLGTLGGSGGSAEGINDAGVVVGYADDVNQHDIAFRWEDGVMSALPGMSSNQDDAALAINEAGEITGTVRDEGGDYHTALWDSAGTLHILEQNPGATDSNGASINERGDVLGLIKINGEWDGAIWTAEGEEILFSDVLPPHHKWTIDIPWDINDIGMICGQGNYPPYTGLFDMRGFVMVPVTPAISLAQPVPGLAGRRNTLTASGVTPGREVYFVYGLVGGGSVIPGCDLAETLAATQIESAKIIGSATANAQGVASLQVNVPNAARNAGDVLIQAVIPADCVISNLVVERFE